MLDLLLTSREDLVKSVKVLQPRLHNHDLMELIMREMRKVNRKIRILGFRRGDMAFHNILVAKLIRYSLVSQIIRQVENWLDCWAQSLRVSGLKSSWLPVTGDLVVVQGLVLEPVLLNIFIITCIILWHAISVSLPYVTLLKGSDKFAGAQGCYSECSQQAEEMSSEEPCLQQRQMQIPAVRMEQPRATLCTEDCLARKQLCRTPR